MSAVSARASAQRLDARGIDRVVALLERGRREWPDDGVLRHQQLLDALDRGAHDRFVAWPPRRPVGVLYTGGGGTVVPAGDPAAGPPLAEAAERTGWRVLIGDAPIGHSLLEAGPRGLFRRRPSAREQRFMVALPGAARPRDGGRDASAAPGSEVATMRRARREDVDVLTDYACRLHVEDRMGPPITAAGRDAVRARMVDSVARGATWVAERDGTVVAKIDIALHSRTRGAQIAGVYVDASARGLGVAGAAIADVTRRLLDEGLPGVTLHVRADNQPAIAAYRRAGFTDRGPWVLALR